MLVHRLRVMRLAVVAAVAVVVVVVVVVPMPVAVLICVLFHDVLAVMRRMGRLLTLPPLEGQYCENINR